MIKRIFFLNVGIFSLFLLLSASPAGVWAQQTIRDITVSKSVLPDGAATETSLAALTALIQSGAIQVRDTNVISVNAGVEDATTLRATIANNAFIVTEITRMADAVDNLSSETLNVNIESVNQEAVNTRTIDCPIISTASNNATNCKSSAGTVHGYWVSNTTGTIYYLRRYNTAVAPDCSSATGLIGAPIALPADTSGAAIGFTFPLPLTFDVGVSYCLTAGSATNDNTNAAVGVLGGLIYQ